MLNEYYAFFWLRNGKQYITHFCIKGSLRFKDDEHYFIDDQGNIRTIDDVICFAALNSQPSDRGLYAGGCLINRGTFLEYSKQNATKWEPENRTIYWD